MLGLTPMLFNFILVMGKIHNGDNGSFTLEAATFIVTISRMVVIGF